MAEAQGPISGEPSEARPRRVLCRLPLRAGAGVLVVCWGTMAIALALSGGANCLPEPGLRAVGDHVAFQLHIWDESGLGSAIALVIYAAVCMVPYALLSGCVRLAARGRTTLFLAIMALVGTVLVALYHALGFWVAYNDLSHSGFMCGFAFDLLPVGGLVVGACSATAASLAALVIERRWRARARP